ncbi:MAG: DUF4268 domain-containing protein [Candidatus Cloacimonetes bacterium]|nr:DUF4268 domain-containing protein [Candidatus Cloacimonadota bacterium]
MENLGRVVQVDLREIWKHEATNFTKWLSKPENLDLLSEEIDIELSLIDTEYNVGRFNVDIFAEEANADRKVIIENQLERTDHDHLGKLITYASGLDAEIIVWIVKEVLEEHQQAIDWLNENTNEKINFFAIKMEVWKIGNSEPAPKFHIISKPNNWSKSVKQSVQTSTLTETKFLQLNFWNNFKQYAQDKNLNLRLRKTNPQHWYDLSFGRTDCHIGLTINSQKKELACEIYIPNSKETFEQFYKNKDKINKQIQGLEWMELPTKKASRIKKKTKGDLKKQEKWDEYFEWLGKTAIILQETFIKY